MSFIERFNLSCPLFGVSFKRGSTVRIYKLATTRIFALSVESSTQSRITAQVWYGRYEGR